MSDTIFTVDSASFQDFEVSASLRAGPSITVDFTQAALVTGSFSGSHIGPGGKLTGVSASYIIPTANATSSYALTSSTANAISFVPSAAASASWVSASIRITTADTASYFITSSVTNAATASYITFVPNTATTATQSINAFSASWVSASNLITSASHADTASFSFLVNSASYAATCSVFIYSNITQSLTNIATQSLYSTQSSYATQSISSSYANTASWAINIPTVVSCSWASSSYSASYVTASNVVGAVGIAQTAYVANAINFVPNSATNSTQSQFASQSINAFSASWVSASAFITTAQTASYVTASNVIGTVGSASTINTNGSIVNAQFYIPFVSIESGSNILYTDSSEGLMYNPGPDSLVTTNIALTGSMTASIISASMEMIAPPPIFYYDVATKGYVDNNNPFGLDFYFRSASANVATYRNMSRLDVPLSASATDILVTAASASQYVYQFISPALGVTNLSQGNINVHYHVYRVAGNFANSIASEIYISGSAGIQILLSGSQNIVTTTTTDSFIDIYTVTSSVPVAPTDRLIAKFKMINGVGNPAIHFTIEDQTAAGITVPVASSNFVLRSGDIMTGNLTVPALTASNGLVVGPSTDSSASFYISGSPFSNIMEVDRNDGAEVFIISPSGSTYIASGSITGSVFGTSSYATNALSAAYAPSSPSVSASYAATASVLLGSVTSISSQITSGSMTASVSTSSFNVSNGVSTLLFVSSSGNVAIGNTAPASIATLNVSGNILLTGFLANSSTMPAGSNFVGTSTGVGAGSATNCNFFGAFAGQNAGSALNSNFFGLFSGNGAANANNSNFFGVNTGQSATNASHSNFFGNQAGSNANNAGYSNFFGDLAGNSGLNSNAHHSNFFGLNAGNTQFINYCDNSNFFGQNSGEFATQANNSNFFGQNSGYSAFSASNSNFIGQQAGYIATRASGSTFIGYQAGYAAASASNSVFIGTQAGSGSTNANNSIFIGYQSGDLDTVNNTVGPKSSILIGDYTSTGGNSDSIAIGKGTMNSTSSQLNLGNVIFAQNIYTGSTTTSASQTNGKVGFNNNNPQYAVDVNGNINFTGQLLSGSIPYVPLSASYAPGSPSISSSYAFTASFANHILMTSSINFNLNSSTPITLGDKGNYILGNNMNLTSWTILCNPSGSIAVEVLWSNYANYPTFTSLTNGNFVSVSASYKNQSTITNWTSSLALGDILKFIVTSSNSVVSNVNLILQGTKYV